MDTWKILRFKEILLNSEYGKSYDVFVFSLGNATEIRRILYNSIRLKLEFFKAFGSNSPTIRFRSRMKASSFNNYTQQKHTNKLFS